MDSKLVKIIRITLWVGGALLVGISGYVGKPILADFGISLMGAVMLYFHRIISGEFMEMYKTTNKNFIRFMTPFAGLAFLIGGLVGLIRSLM